MASRSLVHRLEGLRRLERLRRLQERPGVRGLVEVVRTLALAWREDRVSGLAAEIAFFGVLSVFPGLLALAAGLGSLEVVVGREAAVDTERAVLRAMADGLGDDSASVEAVRQLFTEQRPGLLTLGLALALVSLSRAFGAVIRALDIAYRVEERRPWVHRRLVAGAFATASLVGAVLVLTLLVVGPALSEGSGAVNGEDAGAGTLWRVLRWPVAAVALGSWACALLHLAPNHRTPWRWDVPGAVFAAVTWIATTVGFRAFLHLSGDANRVFGALGGALTLLFWLYLLGIGIVVGGQLNAVLGARKGLEQELRV